MKTCIRTLLPSLLLFFSITAAWATPNHAEIVGGGCGANFTVFESLCPTTSFFDGSIASSGVIVAWHWDFGDGSTSNAQNPDHTYSSNGSYLACLTITTSNFCTDTYCDTVTVSCMAPPSCGAFYQYTLGNCPDVAFFDGSTASPGSITNWNWDFGDGSTSNLQNPAHTYSANGTYVTCLTIFTSDDCTSTYCDTVNVSCIAPVSCNSFFQYTLGNCPDVAFFDGSIASPGSITNWAWDFGDGSTSSMQNPSHTYSANGTYLTCLTISTSDSCTSTYCDTLTISCIEPVSCSAGYQYTLGNCPDVAFFDGSTASPGSITNWNWDFGDGSTSNLQNPAHTYSANGTYVTCLTIFTSDDCTSTYCDTLTISCIEPVSCNSFFQYTLGNCPDVAFFDGSTASPGSITNWFWDFGDGGSASTQNPSHTYTANGTYLTCLTITTSDSCTSTYCDTLTISCIEPVSCSAGYQYTLGNCPDVAFFDGSTASPGSITNWNWDFGDGSTSNLQNPAHTYSSNGTYLTCLTISTSDSCTSTYCDSLTISCIEPVSCSAGYQYTLGNCPDVAFFDGSTASPGSITNWFWDFGDGSTSTNQNPAHTYSSNGTYLTCLTISTSDSCTSTYCDTITIACISPVSCEANFVYNSTICHSITFVDSSIAFPGSITAWSWSFGDGGTSSIQYPSHTYTANGTYVTCLTITTSDSCTSTYCDTISISCLSPTCYATYQYQMDSADCPLVSFTNWSFSENSFSSPGVSNSQWDFGDGSTSTAVNPTHFYSTNGSYPVCLTVTTIDSCTSTACDTIEITCHPSDSCSSFFQFSNTNCPDISFYDGSTAYPGLVTDWLWDFGDGSGSTWNVANHTYTSNGSYVVCLTITTSDSCTSTYCDTVTISCIPPASCDNPTAFHVDNLQPTKALLSWNPQSGAIQYKVKVREVGTSSWTYHTISAPDTFKLKTGLAPGTNYEWKVKTICAANTPLSYGPIQYFTTPSPCLNPNTFNSTNVQANSATFTWNPVVGALHYRVKYRPAGSSSWSYYTTLSTSFTATGLSQSTEYQWKVKTVCEANSPSGYSAAQFFTTVSGCANPTGQTVTNIHETGATMFWNSASGAIQYKLKLRPIGTSGWTYINISDTFKIKNGLLPGTVYEWKVKTLCSSGSPASYGPAHYFTTATDPCPNPVTHTADSITWEEALLYWNTVPNATSYKLKFRVAGASTWFTTTVWAPANYKYKTGLTPNTQYEWKVKTVCASGSPSSYGPVQSFSTLTAESEAQSKLSAPKASINVYPNPSNGQFTVDLGDVFENVTVTIRSMTGRVVYQKVYSELSSESIILEGSSGLYTVELITEGGLLKRMRLVKN